MITKIRHWKVKKQLSAFLKENKLPGKAAFARTGFWGSPYFHYIKVKSDKEKTILTENQELKNFFKKVIHNLNLESSLSSSICVQSEETVNRDFNGNWFYALYK